MKTIILLIPVVFLLVGCGEKTMLDSMTDAATVDTLKACIQCAQGVQDKARGEAKLDEFSQMFKDIEVPAE